MSNAFEANGIITLTTDFGLQDPFVGVMKGVILTRCPTAKIVDLTHGIQPYWPSEAGFWLSRSFAAFPAGTVHAAVVDPGVGTERRILIAEAAGQLFLAPDNGLLSPMLQRSPDARVYGLNLERLGRFDLPPPSATFHGRDIFAPLAAELARGRCKARDLGEIVAQIIVDPYAAAHIGPTEVSGVVVAIDRFGNIITNLDKAHLDGFAQPVLRAAGQAFAFGRTYGERPPGEYLALINAFGVAEIARVRGDAAAGLGLRRGDPVSLAERQVQSL